MRRMALIGNTALILFLASELAGFLSKGRPPPLMEVLVLFSPLLLNEYVLWTHRRGPKDSTDNDRPSAILSRGIRRRLKEWAREAEPPQR